MIAAALLLVLQDDVASLLSRLDSKDPKAAFDAISRLSELPREKVEPAAAKAPAFYRRALVAELAARAALGESFGPATRVTVRAADVPVAEVLEGLRGQCGLKLEFVEMDDEHPSGPKVKLSLEDVPLFDALAEICAATQSRPYTGTDAIQFIREGAGPLAHFAYRGFLITACDMSSTWKVQFGGETTGTAGLSLHLAWDPRQKLVGTGPIEIVEAADDRARAMAVAPAPLGDSDAKPDPDALANLWQGADAQPQVYLRWPGRDSRSISLLRGTLALRYPAATSTFEFGANPKEGESRKDDGYEAAVAAVPGAGQPLLKIRVKPLAGTLAEFRETPVELSVRYKGLPEPQHYGAGRVEEGVPVYSVGAYMGEDGETPFEIESVVVKVHRRTHERKLHFELRDLKGK